MPARRRGWRDSALLLLAKPRPRGVDALTAQQLSLDGEDVLNPLTLAKRIPAPGSQSPHPVTLCMRL